MNRIHTDATDSPDVVPAPTVSPDEAAAVASQRIHSARWWWYAAFDLTSAEERPVVLPVLAAMEFSFSLATDTRDRDRVEEHWSWWRTEVEQASKGDINHPLLLGVTAALDDDRFDWTEFQQLLLALHEDAGPRRYASWNELEKATLSIARAVRAMLIRATKAHVRSTAPIDHLIAAVLLTGRVRDLRDQFVNRDRLVTALADWPNPEFETRLRDSALQGWGVDLAILEESRKAVRATIERIWVWYEECETLPESLNGLARVWCWFALHAGSRLLRKIEMWNVETALQRPEIVPMWRAIIRRMARRERSRSAGSS